MRSAVEWIEEIVRRAGEGGVIALSPDDLHAMRVLVEAGRSPLSARETEVMQAAGRGLSNAAIADALCIEIETVRCHLKAVYRKLGVRGRYALIRYVVEREVQA